MIAKALAAEGWWVESLHDSARQVVTSDKAFHWETGFFTPGPWMFVIGKRTLTAVVPTAFVWEIIATEM